MPVKKDDFSAFDNAVKQAQTSKQPSPKQDDFSAFDEAVKKKGGQSSLKDSQAGELKSTTPTTPNINQFEEQFGAQAGRNIAKTINKPSDIITGQQRQQQQSLQKRAELDAQKIASGERDKKRAEQIQSLKTKAPSSKPQVDYLEFAKQDIIDNGGGQSLQSMPSDINSLNKYFDNNANNATDYFNHRLQDIDSQIKDLRTQNMSLLNEKEEYKKGDIGMGVQKPLTIGGKPIEQTTSKEINDNYTKINQLNEYRNNLKSAADKVASTYTAILYPEASLEKKGRIKRKFAGDASLDEQEMYERLNIPLTEEQKFQNSQAGIDVEKERLEQQYANLPKDDSYYNKLADIHDSEKALISQFPEYKKDQVGLMVAQLASEDPKLRKLVRFGFGNIDSDMVDYLSTKYNIPKVDLQGLEYGDIPANSHVIGNLAKGVYSVGTGLLSGANRIVGTALGVDPERLTYVNKGISESGNKIFGYNPYEQIENSPTVIDTNPKSSTYLQNVPNKKAGKYNYNLASISNALAEGVGGFAGFIGGLRGFSAAGKGLGMLAEGAAGEDAAMTSYMVISGYENNYQDANRVMGEDASEPVKALFAATKGYIDALAFKVLPKDKLFGKSAVQESAEKELAKSLVGVDIKNINKDLLESKVSKVVKGILKTAEETGHITTAMSIADASKAIVNAVMGEEGKTGEYLAEGVQGIKNTLIQTPLSMALPLGIMEGIKYKQHSNFFKENLYSAGLKPDEYRATIQQELAKGNVSEADAKARLEVVDTMSHIVQSTPDINPKTNKKLTHAQQVEYAYSRLKEIAAKAKSEDVKDDEALSSLYKGEAKKYADERTAILEQEAQKLEDKKQAQLKIMAGKELPDTQIVPTFEQIKIQVPSDKLQATQEVITKINNAENINENDISNAEDGLLETLNAHPESAHLIEPLLNKLYTYEFTTKTETRTITEKEPVGGVGKARQQKIPANTSLEQWEGNRATVTDADGKETTGILRKDENGSYSLYNENGDKVASIGEAAITNRDISLPSPEDVPMPIEMGEDGMPKSITLQLNRVNMEAGGVEPTKTIKIEFKDKEKALDLAIQLRAEQVGEVPDAAFEQAYNEVQKTIKTEVPKYTEEEIAKKKEAIYGKEEGTKSRIEEIKELEKQHKSLAEQYIKKTEELIKKGFRGEELKSHPELVDIENKMDEVANKIKGGEAETKKATPEPEKKKTKVQKVGEGLLSHLGLPTGEPTSQAPKVYTIDNINEVDNSGYTGDKKFVIDGIANVVKAINKLVGKSIGKLLTINVHDNPESFRQEVYNAMVRDKVSKDKALAQSKEAGIKGFYASSDGSIHLNMSNVTKDTIFHEPFHAVLDYMEKNNPDVINDLHTQLIKITGKDITEPEVPKVKTGKQFKESAERNYKGDITQKKEAITDFIAQVASGRFEIDPKDINTIQKVRDFFMSMLRKFGLLKSYDKKAYDRLMNADVASIKDLRDLAKLITQKFTTGEEIKTEVKGINEPDVKNGDVVATGVVPKDLKEDKNAKPTQLSKDEETELKRDGILKYLKFGNLSDISGEYMTTTMSDRAVAGDLSYKEGKAYLKKGGALYPLLMKKLGLNRVWASMEKSKLNTLINNLKTDKDGYAYIGIMSMGKQSHMSNIDAFNFVFDAIDAELKDRKSTLTKQMFLDAVNQAYEKKYATGKSIADAVGKPKLNKNMSIAEIKNAVLENISHSDAAFDIRRNFLESLLGNAEKKEGRLGQVPNYKKMAALLEEPLVRDSKNGDVVAYMKVKKSDLSVIKTNPDENGHHNSYPYSIESKSPIDYVFLNSPVHVSDIYPEFINKSGNKVSYEEAKAKYGEEKAMRTHTRNVVLSAPSEKIPQFSREQNENEDIVSASVNVAPLYSTKVTSVEQAELVHNSELYKKYKENNERLAKIFNLEVVNQEDGVGGYEFSNGEAVMEATTVVNVKGKFSDIVNYAAVNGALTPEVQDATIAGMYVEINDKNHTADKVSVTIDNVDAAMKAAEDSGFDRAGFTLINNEISFFNVFYHPKESKEQKNITKEFENKISIFVNKFKEYGGQITNEETRPVRTEYIDNVRRREILNEIKGKGLQYGQGGSGLRDALAKAEERNTRYTTWKYLDKSETATEYRKLRQLQFDLAAEGKSMTDVQRKRISELEKRMSKILTTTFKSEAAEYDNAKLEVDAIANDVAKLIESGYKSEFPTKRPSRAAIKSVRWYNSQPNLLGDGARANVIVNTNVDADFLFNELMKRFPSSVGRTEKVNTELGYPKRLIEIKTSNGKLAEVQVMTPQGYLAKDGVKDFPSDAKPKAEASLKEVRDRLGWDIPDGVGHYFYEINRDTNIPKDLRDQAKEISVKYYDAFLNPESKLSEAEFRKDISDFKQKVDAADKSKWDEGNTGKSPESLNEYLGEAEVPVQTKIEKLRAEEQAELDSKIPNAEQYRVDGKVDRNKLTNKEDIKAFDEVYNKYDKLITPLLKETELPTASVEDYNKLKDSFFGGLEPNKNRLFFTDAINDFKYRGDSRADIVLMGDGANFWLTEGGDGYVKIEDFQVDKDKIGTGKGKAALSKLIEYADKNAIILIGEPLAQSERGRGQKGLSQKQLIDFYKKNGFKKISKEALLKNRSAEDNYLERTPKIEEKPTQFSKGEEEVKGTLDGKPATFIKHPEDLEVVNGFYSPIEKRLLETKATNLSANKWKEVVGRGDEAKFTGVLGWLESLPPTQQVSKSEIQNWMKDNRIEISEVVKEDYNYLKQRKELESKQKSINDRLAEIENETFKSLGSDANNAKVQQELVSNDEYYDLEKENKKIAGQIANLDRNKKDDTKYSDYQLPGEKSNYKEVLITLPKKEAPGILTAFPSFDTLDFAKNTYGIKSNEYIVTKGYIVDTLENKYNLSYSDIKRIFDDYESESTKFKSSHYDEPNILAHIRMNTRVDAEGNKVLHIEEFQSDWGQKGREQGFNYKPSLNDIEILEDNRSYYDNEKKSYLHDVKIKVKGFPEIDSGSYYPSIESIDDYKKRVAESYSDVMGIPSAPFVTKTADWAKLAWKVALKEAIKEGADKITWTTGEQQNDRYNLKKDLNHLDYWKNDNGTYGVTLDFKTPQEFTKPSELTERELTDYFGKEIATKIVSDTSSPTEDNPKRLEGDDLAVGGKGMIGFYGSPKEGKIGIVGEVAKSLFKQEPKTTKLNTGGKIPLDMTVAQIQEIGGVDNVLKLNANTTQHSIDITPEMKAQFEAGLPQFSKSKEQESQIKQYIDNQRKEGVSEEDIRAGIESVADRLRLTKTDIDSLMAGEVKPQVPTAKVEPTPKPEGKTSSIKNAASRQTRIGLNLPEVKLPKIGTDVEALNEGKRLVDEGEIDPDNVIIKVLYGKGTVGMNPDESKAMLYHMTQLKAAETDVRRQMADAETPEDKAVLNGKLQQISDAMDAATEANMLAGKAWSETGHVRQINVDESFNVSRERTIIKDAYGGTIPADVQTRIDKIIAERDAAINERNKIEKALRSRMAKESFEAMMKRANKLKNPAKEVLVNEEKELLTKLKQAFKKDLNNLNAGIPIPKETMEVIGKLAVNYIKQGMVTLDAIVNKIHDQIKGDVPQLSKDDIKDIIGNYRDFEREKEISLLEKKAGRLEKKLTEPEKILPPKKEPLVFRKNTEWVKANQRVANAEFKMKVEKRKALESQKNMYQKGLMWAGRAVRLSVLSGYKVLGKLASAAVVGGAVKRLPEQAIGQVWAHVFRGVAEKAPIEGFSNAKAEAKFYKEFFNPKKFVENSWSILSTGESNLNKRMGTGEYEHVPFLYLPTDLHQIIKDPLKRAAFESSFLNGMIWAEKNGLDINDDLVIQSLETAAYKRANYEIFQEQNGLSKRVSQFKNKLERSGNKGASVKFLIDFLIPVSTVPTNIVRRVFSYSPIGMLKGSVKIMDVYRKGIENLKEEEAEKVMRQLKQGSMGTALWLIGWFGASYFGGLYSKYNPDKKRLEGEIASDEMEIGGEMIPKPVQHAIPLEVIQTAATARHIYDNYIDKKDAGNVEALYRAAMGSIGALIEQVPILETVANVYGAFKEPYYQAKLEKDVKRRFEPQILRETGIIETPKKEEKGGHAGVKLKLKKRGHGGGHHKIKQ